MTGSDDQMIIAGTPNSRVFMMAGENLKTAIAAITAAPKD